MSKKVLLLRFSSLGDVVLTSSLLDPLVKNGFKPILVTYAPYGELFREDKRLLTFEVQKSSLKNFSSFLSLVKRLQDLNPYAVIDLHASLKSLLISKFITAKVKVRYRKQSIKRRLCIVLNRLGLAENLKKNTTNVVQLYSETLQSLGINCGNFLPKIEIERKHTEEILNKYKLREKEYVVLGIGARYKSKIYPHFKNLAEDLTKYFKVVLIGDKTDYYRSKNWKGVLNLCGKLSLIESLHILKGARLFIGNDSGATHMARAVGTKVLVIYGGTHPCLGFAPFPQEGEIVLKNIKCSPCHIHGKNKCSKNFECLDIPPNEVEKKVFKMVLK